MKKIVKILTLVLAFILSVSLASCNKTTIKETENKATTATKQVTKAPTTKQSTTAEKKEAGKAMSHAEYIAAKDDDQVVVDAYVQAHQSWWDNKITVYLADEDGAYFAYNMVCSEADAAKLVPGTHIKVTGYKTTWSGEVEIAAGCTFEFAGTDTYIATAYDVTSILSNETELIKHQNEFVSFNNMEVTEVAKYKWDGSGAEGDDLYFKVKVKGTTQEYSFTVESYLCDKDSDVYKTVKALKVGDTVDLEGFCYWYDGINPHITRCIKTMTHAQYEAAQNDDQVVVAAYVQAHQSWWDNKITVYLADEDGAYFAYNMTCSEADAAKLVPGTRIRITGYKTAWSGEVEIDAGCTFEFAGTDTYIATAYDVTSILSNETELIKHQNEFVSFKNMEVTEVAKYKWDGSGAEGDDLYFKVKVKGTTTEYSFTVESYLCDKDSDVYKAVKALKVGDNINLEGFCYWYNGINPHITSVYSYANAMTHAQYEAAETDDPVVVEAYVQAHQSWWDNKITVYLADKDGAYFAYNMVCSEADAAKLVPGTQIRITGSKTAWSGEVEIAEGCTFEFIGTDTYIAPAYDVTSILSNETELIKHQNEFVSFKNMEVTEVAKYKWDGSGKEGDDLYFKVKVKGTTVEYSFTVESYLCDKDSDVYKAVKALKVGDTVDLEGFCYWYNGINPHITSCVIIEAE